MSAVHLTRAQAEALGVLANAKPDRQRRPATRRRTRRIAPGPYHTICVDCGEVFTTRAAEDRHVTQTHHARYDLIVHPEDET